MSSITYIDTSVKENKESSATIPLVGGIFSTKEEDNKKEGDCLICWLGFNNLTKKAIHTIMAGKGSPRIFELEHYAKKDVLNKANFGSLTSVGKNSTDEIDAAIVTYADVFKMSDVIMVPRSLLDGVEDTAHADTIQNFVIEEISVLIDQKYPIFLEKSWEKEFISQLLKNSLKELLVIGNTPYIKAFSFSVDTSSVEDMLVKAFGKQQFIETYKRAPKIEALWKIVDIEAFNMKTWGPLINYFGGPDQFMEMNSNEQEAIVHLYESVNNSSHEIYKFLKEKAGLEQFYALPLKELAIHSVKSGKKVSGVHLLKAAKTISGAKMKTNKSALIIYSALFSSILKEDFDLEKNCENLTQLIAMIQGGSYKIRKGAEGIALKAAELWLSADKFNDYQSEFLKNLDKLTLPRTYPTVTGHLDKDYSWESIDMLSPDAWFVGLETNCCQHLHSAGATCVKYAAANPDVSGIFRVMKKGNTIAQSWFWFDQDKGNFVFDNIEVLGGEVRDSILQCYLEFIENHLKPRATLFGIKRVSVGLGYNDVQALNQYPKVSDNKSTIDSVGRGSSYSDANSQVLLADFTKEA